MAYIRSDEDDREPLLDETNVFIKYLPTELDEHDLYELFKPYGTITSSKIMLDRTSGHSLGYGFVRYSTPIAAKKCVQAMNGRQIGSKYLLCKLANKDNVPTAMAAPDHQLNVQIPSDNLYVKPLLPDTNTEALTFDIIDDLRGVFERFGKIVECKVMFDIHTGISRQFGFVRFESEREARAALEEMNGYRLKPGTSPLVVKFADTQEQKEARRILQHQKARARGTITLFPTLSCTFNFTHETRLIYLDSPIDVPQAVRQADNGTAFFPSESQGPQSNYRNASDYAHFPMLVPAVLAGNIHWFSYPYAYPSMQLTTPPNSNQDATQESNESYAWNPDVDVEAEGLWSPLDSNHNLLSASLTVGNTIQYDTLTPNWSSNTIFSYNTPNETIYSSAADSETKPATPPTPDGKASEFHSLFEGLTLMETLQDPSLDEPSSPFFPPFNSEAIDTNWTKN